MTTPHPAIPAQRAAAPGWPEPSFEPGGGPGEGVPMVSDPVPPGVGTAAPASRPPGEAGAPYRAVVVTVVHDALDSRTDLQALAFLLDIAPPTVAGRRAKGWLADPALAAALLAAFARHARPWWRLAVVTQ